MTVFRKILPAAAILAALIGALPAFAMTANDLKQAAIVEIGEAGNVAGVARACGIDPTPISAAVQQLMKRVGLDARDEDSALQRYRVNESRMTQATLSLPSAGLCDSPQSLIQDAVLHLDAVGAAGPPVVSAEAGQAN